MIVVISGLPGVGKSAVAAALATRLGAVHLSVDPVEDAVLAAGLPAGWQTGVAAYEATRACAELNLTQGRVVVVDAVNDSEAARSTWRTAAVRTQAPVVFVLLTCADQVEHRRRLQTRVRGFGWVAEPTWPDVVERAAGYEPWGEQDACIVVDAGRDLDLVVDEVEHRVGGRHGPSAAAHTVPLQDGSAVAAARSALTARWRSTVVPADDGGWVVRTWTGTPPGDSRPTGVPNFVHRVHEEGGKPVVQQVHPTP